jgi:hypothetical protein
MAPALTCCRSIRHSKWKSHVLCAQTLACAWSIRNWRTAGVREFVAIPLYLTALLTLAENAPFPATKEELLRRFVAVHEQDMQHAGALTLVMHGLHERFLQDLAVTATRAANTAIAEIDARKSISETDETLVADEQITEKPQPNAALEALVSHHLLVRASDGALLCARHQSAGSRRSI